jgi:hypothetical protein
VALDRDGVRVEASRHLPDDDYRCATCGWAACLKRGRVKVAHFAHLPGAPCCESAGESVEHMRAKAILAQRFRAEGYDVVLEEAHDRHRRRVDVAVTLNGRRGPVRIAVEVQDSAISVDEVKRRTAADRRSGFLATVWVFTTSRVRRARGAFPGAERRLPEEMRYLSNRWKVPLHILDVRRETLMLMRTADASRPETTHYDENGDEHWHPGRVLRSTREIFLGGGQFRLIAAQGPYAKPGHPDWTAVLAPAPRLAHPWRLTAQLVGMDEPAVEMLAAAPLGYDSLRNLSARGRAGEVIRLDHLSTGRSWELVPPRHVWDPDEREQIWWWKPRG